MAARPKNSLDTPCAEASPGAARPLPRGGRGASGILGFALALAVALPLLSASPALAQASRRPGSRPPASSSSPAPKTDTAVIAEALFRDAMALMDAKKYADACPKLEESQRLAPGLGTRYHLGDCYEKSGRRATAWSTFVDLAEAARAAGNADGAKKASARADALLPLPKLTINVPDPVAATTGIEVKRNGVALGRVAWGTAIPVDPGEHVVSAEAPGKKPWSSSVLVDAPSGSAEIAVPPLADASAPEPKGGLGRRGAAIIVGAFGVAGLVAGGVFGAIALSKAGDARAACSGSSTCKPATVAQVNGTYTFADASTGLFIGGGAALAAGAILWLTAPAPEGPASARLRFVPLVPAGGARGAGGLLQGSF